MYREWLANAVPSQRRHVCFVGAEQFVTIDAVECGAKFEQQKQRNLLVVGRITDGQQHLKDCRLDGVMTSACWFQSQHKMIMMYIQIHDQLQHLCFFSLNCSQPTKTARTNGLNKAKFCTLVDGLPIESCSCRPFQVLQTQGFAPCCMLSELEANSQAVSVPVGEQSRSLYNML